MDNRWNIEVSIPEDLDEVIRRGIRDGKETVARRNRLKRAAARSACSFVLILGLFVGGINLSPAFAEAVGELPVVGELVQVFGKNQSLAQGGSQQGQGNAVLTMGRSGEVEWIRLEFEQEQASRYQAEFDSYPKTVTITLPGTESVSILSEITRAQDTSQYIKSVYSIPDGAEGSTAIQLELESDADVQIQEYRDPGSLVIRLTPAEIPLNTVYSVRTLSLDEEALEQAVKQYDTHSVRILRDDSGTYFLEFGQYDTSEQAQAECQAIQWDVIVEARTGNNVPVRFRTMEDYQSSCFLDQYYEVLLHADTVEPVLDFMDRYFAQASRQEQEIMLNGLSGWLEDEEETDWERAAAFYQLAGQPLPESIRQHQNAAQG